MKKLLAILIIAFLNSCEPTSMITGTWKNPTYKSKKYNHILVAALTRPAVAKNNLERDITDLLNEHHVTASKSIDLFPPEVSNSDSDKVALMKKIRGKNIEAVLTISIAKKETRTRYVRSRMPYDPFVIDYYQNFWDYYSFWYPYGSNVEYYTERVYYIETNLYDSKSEKLIWSAQSKTYELLELPEFSKDFAKSIVNRLNEEGLINNEEKKNELNR